MSLPNVLILNQPFVSNTGGGITLTNLFANWNRDKLAVACSGYLLTDNLDPKFCNTYYQLGIKERKWIFPLNLFSRRYYSGVIKLTDKSKNNVVVNKSKFRIKLIIDYMLPLFDYLGFSHFKTKITLSPEFCKWLDTVDPTVLYTQASNREDILLSLAVKKYLKKPLIFHMMDDWPSTLGKKGFMKKYWKKKINGELKLLVQYTDVALSISDYMAEEYKRRFGKEFTTFHNPINIDFWKSRQRKEYHLNDRPCILYAGRIGLGVNKSLKTIAQAIDQVNRNLGMKVKFVLQTQEIPDWIDNYDFVEHHRFVAYEELPKRFAQADFLILPYDFSKKSMDYIKYSMPTKASEYMASGTPIIIFAPEETALIKYARQFKWAEVITENKVTQLSKTIESLIKDKNKRQKIAQNAKVIAVKRHNLKDVSDSFEHLINSVALNYCSNVSMNPIL